MRNNTENKGTTGYNVCTPDKVELLFAIYKSMSQEGSPKTWYCGHHYCSCSYKRALYTCVISSFINLSISPVTQLYCIWSFYKIPPGNSTFPLFRSETLFFFVGDILKYIQ